MDKEKWSRLDNLKHLYEEGFITLIEYENRKSQLIDELTGTSMSSLSNSIVSNNGTNTSITNTNTNTKLRAISGTSIDLDSKTEDTNNSLGKLTPTINISNLQTPPLPPPIILNLPPRQPQIILPMVVSRGPPTFTDIPIELANKYTYEPDTRRWVKSQTKVKIDPIPFARGALRFVYHLKDINANETYVAKMSIDPRDNLDRTVYFKDVEMQSVARLFASKFNTYTPPKRVDFVDAWLLELVQRPGNPICGVERYIDGNYKKHNNNYGYVSEDDRNTPQAFSHFTYEASGHTLLVCDIQGVGDLYTDPQMHTLDGKGYGKGNLGKKGFDKFVSSHQCNVICEYLRMPAINSKAQAVGTLPAARYMEQKGVDVIKVSTDEPHYNMLPPLSSNHNKNLTDPLLDKDEVSRCSCVIL